MSSAGCLKPMEIKDAEQKDKFPLDGGIPEINELVREEDAREFLKFIKHNEYNVVEQLHKQPARISILTLLLSSEAHRNALLKVLNQTFVPSDVSVYKLDRLVNNLHVDNFISFSEDKIPPEGTGRPWIHAAGAVPSTLYQKVKFVIDGRLVSVGAEEDIIASASTDAPYIDVDENLIECTFRSLEFVSATFVAVRKKIPKPRLSKNTMMGVRLTVGK
ncbi:hypothetical protein V6N13_058206 [Hibiscus sabdariffa]